MSHDAWVELPDPDDGDEALTLTQWRNYTRNCSRMWHWSVQLATEGRVQLVQDTDGWPVTEAHAVLRAAVEAMTRNADRLREWEPDNGWGTYEGALAFLADVTEDCRRTRGVTGAVLRWSV